MADENKKSLLEMAEELNDMDRDMSSGDADFHDQALRDLRKGKKLKPKDEAKIELLYEKYLAEKPEEDEEDAAEPETEDEGDSDI